MKKIRWTGILVFLATFGLIQQAIGQLENHLILKKGHKNVHHYLVGDEIRFTDFRSDVPIIGTIQEIGEDFLTVEKIVYPLTEIQTIVHRRKGFNFRAAGSMLQFAGPGFLVISGFNALINGIRPIWTLANIITGASISLTGLLLPHLQDKVYNLNQTYYLRIVPADPGLHQTLK